MNDNHRDHTEFTRVELEAARLTAYALGQLDEQERAEVEALLARDEQARRTVEETAALAEHVLRSSPQAAAAPSSDLREAIEQHVQQKELKGMPMKTTKDPLSAGPAQKRRFSPATVAVSVCLLIVAVGLVLPAMRSAEESNEQVAVVDNQIDEDTATSQAAPAETPSPPTIEQPAETEPLSDFQRQFLARIEAEQKALAGQEGVSISGAPPLGEEPKVWVDPEAWQEMLAKRAERYRSTNVDQRSGIWADGGPITGAESDSLTLMVTPRIVVAEGEERLLGIHAPGTEQYDPIVENEFLAVTETPLSTFSVDVDTASYANVRRFLNSNQLPPPDAVRIEELINYFSYDSPAPEDEATPFSVNMEVAQCPWNNEHRLVRVGLKGKEIDADERGPSNLVFLLDVSGSMRNAMKLDLVKQAMSMLVDQLTEDDRVAIVTYASGTEVRLPSTDGHERETIRAAIDTLTAGGST
ncbi:MAG TPA: von Willebrand factor type A domain-containing protein, partial [Thermoguttaceae bacterium]|nr:von Willebrand factor type A domain-containing protein [Thermoguttaceae bacterium]